MRCLPLAAALGLVPLCTLAGQLQLSADLGSSILRQTGLPESAVFTAGADLRWAGNRATLTSSALAASASDGRGTGQALVIGALHAPADRRARWQLAGAASTYGLTNDLPTVSLQLMAREYVGGAARGVFAGAGGAGIVRNRLWRPALVAQSGGWWRRAADQLVATITATSTVAEEHQNFPAIGDYTVTHQAAYIDLSSAWQRDGRAFSLTTVGGIRGGLRGVTGVDAFASLSAERWVAPRVAVVGAIGRALGDVVRGVPPTRYATIALRVALQPRAGLITRPSAQPVRGPRLVVAESGDSARRTIEVHVESASSVEIIADFTSWEAVALTRDPARPVWRLERVIEPGPHRIAVRVDGGAWNVPTNLPRVSNGFGGTVGLVTVP